MTYPLFAGALAASVAVCIPLAHGHEAGDVIFRVGAARLFSSEDSSSIDVDQGGLAGTDLQGNASISNDTQAGLTATYMLTDHFGIEAMATTPFRAGIAFHDTILDAANISIGSLKQVSPTVSLVYYPLASGLDFQPYMGAGVSRTWFFGGKIDDQAAANRFDNLRASNAWGWAAQLGFDYMLTENLLLNAQVRYIDTSTTLYLQNTALGVRMKSDVDIGSWIGMVGLGYKF